MKKLELTDIMIEVTRRCNMKCCHCLCGDAQNVDIDFTYITNILKHVSHIEKLIFTGGEPSLNIEAIKFTLNQIKRRKIQVGRFSIVTNGSLSSIDPQFIAVCKKLYEYQYEEENLLYLSNDEYHDNTYHSQGYRELSKLHFFDARYWKHVPYRLIKMGRSESGIEISDIKLIFRENKVIGMLFLNSLGYVLSQCNYSYIEQEKHYLCHSKDIMIYLTDFNLNDKLISEYNQK